MLIIAINSIYNLDAYYNKLTISRCSELYIVNFHDCFRQIVRYMWIVYSVMC